MSSGIYDVIVVGAGIEGSSTAYQLSQRASRVLLLEQFPLPHSRGSSHGQSRITRKLYPQTFYTEMMKECTEAWECLNRQSGETIYSKIGYLEIGGLNSTQIVQGKQTMQQQGADFIELSPHDLSRKFPMLRYPSHVGGLLDPEGGILMADKALMAMQKIFKENGGHLVDGAKVTNIVPGDPVVVETSKGDYRGRSLVLACGSWTNRVVQCIGLRLPLQPIRISVCYWPEEVSGTHAQHLLPTFYEYQCCDGHSIYGLPSIEYPGHVKLCLHHGPDIDPENRDAADSQSVLDLLSQYVQRHFPGLKAKPSVVETCIYTNTPDRHFILDRHPIWRNIIVGAGFSGHGFKLAPAVGNILADLALGQTPKYDLTHFKMARFPSTLVQGVAHKL